MTYERDEIQATISTINSFSGTAVAVVMYNGTSKTYSVSWRPERPRIDEGDVVKIRPISSNFARITEVVSRRIEPTEGVDAVGNETFNEEV